MTKNFVAYRLLIDDIDYSSMSLIIHWCYWLLIDYLLITHWLLIDYTYIIMLHIYYNFPVFFFIITDFTVINLYVNGSRQL